VQARNNAESTVHNIRKDIEELRTELTAEQIDKIEAVCKELEEAAKGTDREAITSKISEVMVASEPIFKAKASKDSSEAKTDDTVVDADFTEKKD
jgi:molecular chaperone DnaK